MNGEVIFLVPGRYRVGVCSASRRDNRRSGLRRRIAQRQNLDGEEYQFDLAGSPGFDLEPRRRGARPRHGGEFED